MKLLMTACIEAPKESVWKVLSDVSNVDLWVGPIMSAKCEGAIDRGVGTVRVCKLRGDVTVTERWVSWDEGDSFSYQADATSFFQSARNTWSVKSENGKTLVTTESEVVLKGGVFGKIFEPLMYMISKKMGADSLSALKYFVENGTPYKGSFSKLPRAPVAC